MKTPIAIIADRLQPPYDEGIKNIAVNFIREVSTLCGAALITDKGSGIVERTSYTKLGRSFLRTGLWRLLKRLRPEVIFYLPSTSLTVLSIVRGAALKALSPRSKVYIVGLQSRRLSGWAKLVLRVIRPHGLIVLSETMRQEIRGISPNVEIFTPGVNTGKFKPVTAQEKARLRAVHGLPPEARVVLHVGHVKRSRNLTAVLDALEGQGCNFVVVASSTFQHQEDRELHELLLAAGVRIVSGAIEAIEEWFQMADCYVFPVVDRTAATEMPLSVLEAMAVNIPVVTTPYGALVDAFAENPAAGLFYAADSQTLAASLAKAAQIEVAKTRDLVANFSWAGRVANLMERLKVV